MDSSDDIIAGAACELAGELPLATLKIAARAIHESQGLAEAKNRIAASLPQPHHRQLAISFLDHCSKAQPNVSTEALALALTAAGETRRTCDNEESVELVWTGPDTGAVPFRRTEQAILQVLDSAQHRITLVSYAVYAIPRICEALVQAARRGVKISVIVETPDKIAGQSEYSTLLALGPEVAACSTVYYWPQEKRRCHGEKCGILHVKCAVADGRWLFLSSANLTEYAFTINMELGVLIAGGSVPEQVEANFDRLVATGVVERI
jgi:phosphatidylserine/phosphatidylglycerophosphate/cardiolipin synthase-like enzyme